MIHASLPDRQQRRHQERLDEWLDAALDVVAECGLAGLTIKGLAQRVDRSVGAIYRYVPSKDALIAALGARVLDELGNRLDETPSTAPLEAVREMVDVYCEFAVAEPARFGLIQGLVGEPRQILEGDEAQAVAESMRALLARVAGRLQAAVECGALAPGDTVARTIQLWAGLHGVLQLRKFGRFDERMVHVDPIARSLAESLLRAWATEETSR